MCGQPCVNGGTCLRPNQCACPLGWTGHQCQTGNIFYPNVLAELRTNLSVHVHTCFRVFLFHLSDVDECRGKHPCDQQCMNTAGSYRCACSDGFRLAGDGRSCQSLPPSPTPPPPPPPSPAHTGQAAVGGQTDTGK